MPRQTHGSLYSNEPIDPVAGRQQQQALRRYVRPTESCVFHLEQWLADATTEMSFLRSSETGIYHFAHGRKLFAQAVPFAQTCRSTILLRSGKPEALLGEMNAMQEQAHAMHNACAVTQLHIHAAGAWILLEEHGRADASLREALVLAEPDQLLMPFAENYGFIALGLKRLSRECASGRLASIAALAERVDTGRGSVARSLFKEQLSFDMTLQEYRVATLAADGFTTQEMANSLDISVNTIKSHVKAVYRKCQVNSRPSLRRRLKQN